MKASPNTLLVAVTVIFVGVILLLGNMGIIPNNMMAMWPLILIIAGLIGLTLLDGSGVKNVLSTPAKSTTSKSKPSSKKKSSSKKKK